MEINFKNVHDRKDYLSVDGKNAISAHGEIFHLNDKVRHESEGTDEAIINKFSLDRVSNDVIAHTTRGTARICFIYKV